jgi:hypothetical protein
MKPIYKQLAISLVISSMSMPAFNAVAFGRGGSHGGGGMARAAMMFNSNRFMREGGDFNRFNREGSNSESYNHSDYGRNAQPSARFSPGAFRGGNAGRGISGGTSAGRLAGSHPISAATERSSYVQDYNWGKTPAVRNYGNFAPMAKTPTIASGVTPSNPDHRWQDREERKFADRHPRRAEVLGRDQNLNHAIQANKGDLNGHYKQLKREDGAIKRQEQADARFNGGHITPAEKRQLNREENRLARQIKHDDGKGMPFNPGGPNKAGTTEGTAGSGSKSAPANSTSGANGTPAGNSPVSSAPTTGGASAPSGSGGTQGTSYNAPAANASAGNGSNAAPTSGGLAMNASPSMSPQMLNQLEEMQAAYEQDDSQDKSDNGPAEIDRTIR